MFAPTNTVETSERTETRWWRDLLTGGLGVLLVAGVFIDGWAHFNRPGMESFFTPWHAALYSGLGVLTAWLAWVAWNASGGTPRRVVTAMPAGYGLAMVGAALFAFGGLADLAWHELFGIEVALDSLLSPTHLLLGAGGVLILSTGMRSQGVLRSTAGPSRWATPAVLSLVLTLAVVVFFLLYTSAFAAPGPVEPFTPTPEGTPGHEEAELPVIASLGSYLLTTVVIILPVLLMQRGRGIPRGGMILVVATVSMLPVIVVDLPRVPLAGAVGAILAAAVADLAAPHLQQRLGRESARWVIPGLLAGLVWSGQLAGLAVVDALRWPVSLWAGVALLGTLLAAVIGFTTSPHGVPHRNAAT
jgi:hypothetical protein